MHVDKIHDNLAIKRLVQRPNQQICQEHQEADDEAADDEDIAKDEWKNVCFYPVPHATHCDSF